MGWWRSDRGVAVRAGDHDVEVVLVLTVVGGGVGGDGGVVENTLDVGGRWWVGAAIARGDGWVTLEVDVEAEAAGDSVTVLGTLDGVVGSQSVVSEVAALLGSAIERAKGLRVSIGGRSSTGGVGVLRVSYKGVGSVWGRGRPGAVTSWSEHD